MEIFAWLSASWLSALVGLTAFVVAALFLHRYVRNTDVRAQLEAKDQVIKTNQQTIESITQRLDELETHSAQSDARIQTLETALDEAKRRYAALERYAAPKALNQVLALIDAQDLKLDALIVHLLSADQQLALTQHLRGTKTARANAHERLDERREGG